MVGDGDMMEVVRVFIPRRESSMIPCLISSDTLSHSYAFAGDSSHGYLNMRASVSRPARQIMLSTSGSVEAKMMGECLLVMVVEGSA